MGLTKKENKRKLHNDNYLSKRNRKWKKKKDNDGFPPVGKYKSKNPSTYQGRNSLLKAMGIGSYERYQKTVIWKMIRTEVYQRDGKKCRICRAIANAAHHFSYSLDTLLGRDIDEIICVCRSCHRLLEFEGENKREFHKVREMTMEALALADSGYDLSWY